MYIVDSDQTVMWVLFTHQSCLGKDVRSSHLTKDLKATFTPVNRVDMQRDSLGALAHM